ncbi:MAG: VWA domain-containing protein [Planctomycetes bacterium]|nr:VWA domain-containing protein [Planctomycetota bacterium]
MIERQENPSPASTTHFTTNWEQVPTPDGRPVAVEITLAAPASRSAESPRRNPLNIGIAIDRSGSMSGPKLRAACDSAAGLLDGLADGERLAAIAFESEVTDVCASTHLDAVVRDAIRPRLTSLEPGGCTALFDGFVRAAQLVAEGGNANDADAWVIVLSDGMGNRGLVDPAAMRVHASVLAERGVRTISIGIGADYQATQLEALATGGRGEFHHASEPNQIVEIVLGELNALRSTAASDLRVGLSVSGTHRWLLLGGHATQQGDVGESRIDRLRDGGTARVIALLWPSTAATAGRGSVSWVGCDGTRSTTEVAINASRAPAGRDVALALRAARLWQAHIVARAFEMNERGEYAAAGEFVGAERARLAGYVLGLPGADEILAGLDHVAVHARREGRTIGKREAYAWSRKALSGKADLRQNAPASVTEALFLDRPDDAT